MSCYTNPLATDHCQIIKYTDYKFETIHWFKFTNRPFYRFHQLNCGLYCIIFPNAIGQHLFSSQTFGEKRNVLRKYSTLNRNGMKTLERTEQNRTALFQSFSVLIQ